MMSFIQTLHQELKTIFSDIAIVLTVVGGVLLYSFLYPQPYINESVSKVKVSVVDNDKTDMSRDLLFMLGSTPQLAITQEYLSEKEAKEALLDSKVQGLIVIPKDFKKDTLQHKQPVIAIGADSSYFLIFGGVVEGAMKSILTTGASLKVANLLKNNTPLVGAKMGFTPYSLEQINLFNKNNSYTQYVIPAVFVLILQQTMLIGLGIFGGGINERAYKNYNYETNTLYVMLSRYIIFVTLFFIHLLFYFGFSFSFFGITHLASIPDLIAFSFLFLSATLFFGIFIGALFSSREIATPAVLFSSLALVFSAGFVWPLEALPSWLVVFSNFFPSTPAIEGFLKLNQMGAEMQMVLKNALILFAQAFFYAILGYYLLNKKRKNLGKI